jgi:hypothetical protein
MNIKFTSKKIDVYRLMFDPETQGGIASEDISRNELLFLIEELNFPS